MNNIRILYLTKGAGKYEILITREGQNYFPERPKSQKNLSERPNVIILDHFGPIVRPKFFFGLGLGQKNSAQGQFGPTFLGPLLGLGQSWAKLVYRPGPIWAGPGLAQTHP